jgi:hypothetical protein
VKIEKEHQQAHFLDGFSILNFPDFLFTKMQQIASTPVTPTTPSCFTPITPSAFNELKAIFSNQQDSLLVVPLPERNTKTRKASFLLDKISQQELLAPFKPLKEE